MRNKAYYAPLVLLPVVIDRAGRYKTRAGEEVEVFEVSARNDHGCIGAYLKTGIPEHWHRSGRVFAGQLTDNDIVRRVPS